MALSEFDKYPTYRCTECTLMRNHEPSKACTECKANMPPEAEAKKQYEPSTLSDTWNGYWNMYGGFGI